MLSSSVVKTWLYLIGTPERAERLNEEIWRLDGLRHRNCGGDIKRRVCQKCSRPIARVAIMAAEPKPSPEVILFGILTSRQLYADPEIRPALDAWDCGLVGKADIKRFAEWIMEGRYHGPVYEPERPLRPGEAHD